MIFSHNPCEMLSTNKDGDFNITLTHISGYGEYIKWCPNKLHALTFRYIFFSTLLNLPQGSPPFSSFQLLLNSQKSTSLTPCTTQLPCADFCILLTGAKLSHVSRILLVIRSRLEYSES